MGGGRKQRIRKPLPSRLQAWVDARKRHRLSHAQVVSVEAEDILDSLVGHIAGRAQPDQFAPPGDWAILVDHADTYRRAAPWRRWTDQDHLDLEVRLDGTSARYVTIVIGAEGVQRSLVLYPGGALPDGVGWLAAGRADPGTGWKHPVLPPPAGRGAVGVRGEGSSVRLARRRRSRSGVADHRTARHADLDRTAVQRLTVAIAAVLAHDRRPDGSDPTIGTCTLAASEQASYTLHPPR